MSTLDIFHQEYLSKNDLLQKELEENQNLFLKFSEEVDILEQSRSQGHWCDADYDHYVNILDKKQLYRDEVARLKRQLSDNTYMVNTSDILFKYYELLEKGDKKSGNSSLQDTQNSILKYFVEHKKTDVNNDITRGTLLNNYMSLTDSNFISKNKKHTVEEKCEFCGSCNLVNLVNDGYMYCESCNTVENLIIDHNKPSYKDPPKEITYFSYKRINHLNEWLNQIQGKETTDIPEEIYDKILLEIKKQRITNMADITYDKMKRILKQLKVHKYYEHIPHIINRLNGLPMPNFSPELEDKLRSMFKQIQTPFLKHSPAKRKNFLSYSYVLKKFLQLLEEDQYLVYFQLLKSRDKLASQDKIWKSICEEVGWQFIPSL